MTATPAREEVERFRTAVTERLGLQFDDGKLDYLADVLRQCVAKSRADGIASYLVRLADGVKSEEVRALAQELTVPETYFFRNPDHFRAVAEVVLPDRGRANAGRPLRILSAGCASGEEAYSLAIVVHEHLIDPARGAAEIVAVDINPAVIAKARRAHYSAWSFRETSAELRARYFERNGLDFVLDPRVRSMVAFEERNLIEDDAAFWRPETFDVVFCRNVIMYFSPEVMRNVIARVARALVPGGFLFLGHAETLRGISQDFHLRHTHETFYYQRRETPEIRSLPTPRNVPVPAGWLGEPAAELPELGDSWVDAIQRAGERIATLARSTGRRPAAASAPPSPAAAARWDLGVPVELLRRERFADAMTTLGALPPESKEDPDVQLLRAVLLTNAGDLGAARDVCEQLLERDGLNAGAHYLMALCLEHAGDLEAAVEHDRVAVYLDAAFAMPHLHLGLAARRAGHVEVARRALGQALTLLTREDSSRVLLFGGGFSREALVELCRAELHGCTSAS